jgi:NAD(P)-dependent dehydrogenase (short-subunit alcohol dehydrogenase family)
VTVKDRAAIVTGAGSGIGEGIAKALARAGAKVCVADVNPHSMQRVVGEIQAEGSAALGVEINLTQAEQVESMCRRVAAEFGRLDILVNNAGIIAPEVEIDEMSEETWDKILTVNLKSQYLTCRSAVRLMKQQQYGRIVNIASRSWLGGVGLANYAASKGGVVSLTRSLAIEMGKYGITVNCVSPTLVVTPLFLGMPPEEQERDLQKAKRNPIPRLGKPEDVAVAVLFFASDEAEFITGQHLYVGGGGDLMTSGAVA